MDALFVLPYFLVRFFEHFGANDGVVAGFVAALLGTTCFAAAMMAPFHRKVGAKIAMVAISWSISALAVAGFLLECEKPRPTQVQAPPILDLPLEPVSDAQLAKLAEA